MVSNYELLRSYALERLISRPALPISASGHRVAFQDLISSSDCQTLPRPLGQTPWELHIAKATGFCESSLKAHAFLAKRCEITGRHGVVQQLSIFTRIIFPWDEKKRSVFQYLKTKLIVQGSQFAVECHQFLSPKWLYTPMPKIALVDCRLMPKGCWGVQCYMIYTMYNIKTY